MVSLPSILLSINLGGWWKMDCKNMEYNMTRQHLPPPNHDKAMLWNIICYAERRNPRVRKPRREVLHPIHFTSCFSDWIIIAFGMVQGIISLFWKAHTFLSNMALSMFISPVSNITNLPCLSLPCRYYKYKVSTKRHFESQWSVSSGLIYVHCAFSMVGCESVLSYLQIRQTETNSRFGN